MAELNLKECPSSPNCVSTQTSQPDKLMSPIPFSVKPEVVRSIIEKVMLGWLRVEVLTKENNYFHFSLKSAVFRFVDDIEFIVDEKSQHIHFRSASRVGYSDLGVNRKRMSEITKKI
ncbi:MAG: DUF1499 domain-containing protein [Pseudobdellovibrionaceae bacterium]|nr:DUF1499 domain-containing protein [Bdellovibrionales bacterium]USN47087.1 MAG: DUF1499 domain-containing protein [Pseudobdellovibrionaceae bacterium]